MTKKVKLILLLLSLSICLGLVSNTYSRYVANTKGNISAAFSKWQILVDNNDITNNSNSTIDIVPILEENNNVADNVIAPSSKGYFDINIDPTNVDVSFSYIIDLQMENDYMPDLMITKYAILPDSYEEGEDLDIISLENSKINNTLLFNKENSDFRFKTFTVRIYFEWYEGENETMNDEDDTNIAMLAVAEEDLAFKMHANISFEQFID